MLLLSLATLPSSTEFLANIGAWSAPLFTDLLPFAVYAIGILVALFLVWFLISALLKVLHKD